MFSTFSVSFARRADSIAEAIWSWVATVMPVMISTTRTAREALPIRLRTKRPKRLRAAA